MTTTVETIRFTLRDGVDEADFVRRNATLEADYMTRRPGFLSREVARSDDGEWFVVVHWASEADADLTQKAFFAAPESQEFLAAVDLESVRPGRYRAVPIPAGVPGAG